MAKMTFIRTLIALVAARRWPLYQMNVKNVFMNGGLCEIVYMQLSSGVFALPEHVCRFRRALYGLKQAPRALYERF